MFLQYVSSLKLSVLFLTLSSVPVYALSADDKIEANEQTLIQLISKTDVLHCQYQQRSFDKEKHALQNFTGVIAYQRPHNFYWSAGEPLLQTIVSDGKFIWHLDKDLEQVVVQSYQSQAESALLLSVLEAPETLFKTYQVAAVESDLEKTIDSTRYQLSAKASGAPLKSLSLTFTGKHLSAFSFVDNLQQTTTITFESCDALSALPSFSLKIPKGFDAIYE